MLCYTNEYSCLPYWKEINPVEIDFLIDRPEFMDTVAEWCCRAWPRYYDGDLNRAMADQRLHLNRDTLPCTLVAYAGAVLLGTIALLREDMEVRPKYSPWLGSFFVAPEYRGRYQRRSVGLELLAAGGTTAKRMGFPVLYSWTPVLGRHLRKHGWQLLETVDFMDVTAEVLQIELT